MSFAVTAERGVKVSVGEETSDARMDLVTLLRMTHHDDLPVGSESDSCGA